jgi:hypothetical protein
MNKLEPTFLKLTPMLRRISPTKLLEVINNNTCKVKVFQAIVEMLKICKRKRRMFKVIVI